MSSNTPRWFAALLCGGLLATTAAMAAPEAGRFAANDAFNGAHAAERQLQTLLDEEERQLRAERATFRAHFDAAYTAYPRIPRGTLEAIAYTQSRWQQLNPDGFDADLRHHSMPRAWGVMGLYHGEGFGDQVSEAAHLLGLPVDQVLTDPAANILAAAVLLDRELDGAPHANIAGLAPALQAYARFALDELDEGDDGQVQSYARASFAFDVLLTLDRGVDDRGITIPEQPVHWEAAFTPDMLIKLEAPFLRLDVEGDSIETDAYRIDPITQTLQPQPSADGAGRAGPGSDGELQSTDYGPALWLASPNYSSRGGSVIREAVIHTTQGSYAGAISWLRNPVSQASAHYVIRSSDGQITQLVRESQKAWHARSHNPYSLGIEHEGFISNSSWYTTAMYNASAGIVRNFCARYSRIACSTAYKGAGHNGRKILGDNVHIKGHQHLSGNDHTDPGIYWNWSRYYGLINPGSGGGGGGSGTRVLDSFESSVGHFNTSPTYSGSTTGISTASSATRNCSLRRVGNCSLHVQLIDKPGTSAPWSVRLLSGAGNPGSNVSLARNGRIGFWAFAAGTGMTVAVGIDDRDGTERSISRSLPANSWTYVEWKLSDAAQWRAWAGNSNGKIDAANVTLDAIWLMRAETQYTVNVYIDDVQIRY